MVDFSQLNTQQLEAVHTIEGAILLLAGAGTGKTKVLCSRIINMLDKGISSESILAVTFTNKAAKEMYSRIKSAISLEKYPLIGTFHSFCLKVLKKYYYEAGLYRDFKIISSSEQIDLVRRCLEEKGLSGEVRADFIHSKISSAKNSLLSYTDLYNELDSSSGSDNLEDFSSKTVVELYGMYERQLKLNNVIDFDDCIFKVVDLLKNNEDIRKELSDKYKYVLIDEFQDTNFAQLSLVKLLASHGNVCVVGDDDQSIYSWRGALSSTFNRFLDYFKEARVIKLEQNYRCSNPILKIANRLIENNSGRIGKTLWSNNKDSDLVKVLAFKTDEEELEFVAKKCISFMENGYKPKDIAILYRTNSQSKDVELFMREYNIKYKVFGGQSFFERKEVKDFLSYLYLIINPNDAYSFWRVINIPARGVGLKTLEKIEEKARELKKSPLSVCKDKDVKLTQSTQNDVDAFIDGILSFHANTDFSKVDGIEKICMDIIRVFKLDRDIKLKVKDDTLREKKLTNLHRLPSWMQAVCRSFIEENNGYSDGPNEKKIQNKKLDIKEVLDALSLSDVSDKEEEVGNYVSLMTVHSAKGLEFPVVFIIGMEKDLFPHKNSYLEKDGIEEERRLFYVAITRAKKYLFITRSKSKQQGKEKYMVSSSMFLDELPKELVQSSMEEEKKTEEERKKRLRGKLSSLREEFL